MMNRAAGSLPLWEYLATTVLLLLSIYFAVRGAGKVFRIGILMTGQATEVGRGHALVDGQRRHQPGGARSGPGQLSGIRRLARTRMLCSMVEASGALSAWRKYSLKASMALRYSRVWW